MVPDAFLDSYFKGRACIVAAGSIFAIGNAGDGQFLFHGKQFGLEKIAELRLLEQAYLEAHCSLLPKLPSSMREFADIIVNRICKEKQKPRENMRAVNDILSGDFLAYNGRLFPLVRSIEGDIKIGKKSYCLGRYVAKAISDVEQEYIASLQNIDCNMPERYYNEKRSIGYEIIEKSFYAITKIAPYILYERLNSRYYKFGPATIGAALYKEDKEISSGKLKVLSSYSHPSLPCFDKPMQTICVGNFDYGSIRKRHPGSLEEQIVELMRKGRHALTMEYKSRGKPYHFLTEKYFEHMETASPEARLVTNR